MIDGVNKETVIARATEIFIQTFESDVPTLKIREATDAFWDRYDSVKFLQSMKESAASNRRGKKQRQRQIFYMLRLM